MAEDKQGGQRVALVAGGSGLTGSALLRRLLTGGEYSRVYAVTRRPLLLDHPRLANRVLPLENIGVQLKGLRCDDLFCALGTAHPHRAGLGELQAVDRDLVAGVAQVARSFGATRCVVISASGADAAAPRPLARAKGEMEAVLRDLRFTSLNFLRPGRVLGLRSQMAIGDMLQLALLPLLNPLLTGPLDGARGIGAADLAAAMVGAARAQRTGVQVFAGATLKQLAAGAQLR